MLKPLDTEFSGRRITLECTHKKQFPPPRVFGLTPNDIDIMWRQGGIDQNEYQQLQTWRDNCGLMVMGPRCLDCPLANLRKPRPGRPEVYDKEPWLKAKKRFALEDMAKNKTVSPEAVASSEEVPTEVLPDDTVPDMTVPVDEAEEPEQEAPEDEGPAEAETDEPGAPGLDDDLISALADD